MADSDSWRITPGSSFAEVVYQNLPPSAKELRCKCTSKQPKLTDRSVLLCATCLKPSRYSLSMCVKECEGCEQYYVNFKPPELTWPEHERTIKLCDTCSSKVRTHGPRPVAKRFKLN